MIFSSSTYQSSNLEGYNFDLKEIKLEIRKGAASCLERLLHFSYKWLTELNHSLNDIRIGTRRVPFTEFEKEEEYDDFLMATSYFNEKEYERCAFFLKSHQSRLGRFIYFYARYMATEKKRTGEMTEATVSFDSPQLKNLRDLAYDLKAVYHASGLDGWCLYLYGVVLKKLELLKQAEDALINAIHKEPMHWGAWLELAPLIKNKNKLDMLDLPNHWIKHFFFGYVYLELQLYVEAADIFENLQRHGFQKSNFVFVQMAMISHNKRDVDKAIEQFQQLQVEDPYRLDNLDTYSNLLYVKELRIELAHLAHQATEIDKFRVETCCVIGNYYSLRAEHQKAVVYFQRALKLNPQYLSAWTLMGHEFMEMKNTNAAIQCYRQAIEVNRRDYRAWYGLGQTYEILKMFFYCLHYYKQAHMLRPNDSRMLIALGETYEKLDKPVNAHKCYYQARSVGDIEATALLKLAKLFEKLNDDDQAATAYTEYVNEVECRQLGDPGDHSAAYKYLANYHVKRNLDLAYSYAQQCLEYEETKEEGKALLRTISQKRTQMENVDQMLLEEGFPTDITLAHTADSLQTPNFSPISDTSGPMNLSFNLHSSSTD